MKFNKDYFIKDLLIAVNYTDNIIGNDNAIISGFCDDYFANERDLTWTNDRFVLNKLVTKNCNLIIITNIQVSNIRNNNSLILCSNPLRLFESIVNNCFRWPDQELQVGEKTIVHDTVIIGNNVVIGNNCIIDPYVIIGDNVVIGDNVHIGSFSTIGNNPYYTIWDNKKSLRTRFVYGNVCIGNNVHIGSYCSIDNGITSTTEIGAECKFGNFVEIGHDVRVGNNCCICAQCAIGGYVRIGSHSILWGRVGVSNRISIAPNTTLLAASVVTKNIPEGGMTYCGYPAMERMKYWRSISKKNV